MAKQPQQAISVIAISPQTHKKLKALCKRKGWLIGTAADRAVREFLSGIQSVDANPSTEMARR